MKTLITILSLIFAQISFAGTKTWTGNTNSNWNLASNWSSSGVPGSGDNVIIPGNPSGGNMPLISSGIVTIKSLTIQGSAIVTQTGGELYVLGGSAAISGTYNQSGGNYYSDKTLTVNNGGFFLLSGSATLHMAKNSTTEPTDEIIINNGGTFNQSGGTIEVKDFTTHSGSATGTFLQSGGTFRIYHDFIHSGVFTATGGVIEFAKSGGGASFPGTVSSSNTQFYDVVINSGVDPKFGKNADCSFKIAGNWTNNSTATPLVQKITTVTFNGTGNQVIGGSESTEFYNLTIQNTGGGILLNKAVSVEGLATFSAGILTTSSVNLLTFLDNAATSGANNNLTNPSFVHGPVKKIGNDPFTFPVGKVGAGYHPCSISSPASNSDAFTAEYIRASALALGTISVSGLNHVSSCDYWNIDRTAGSSSVNVTLSWNGYSNCNAAAYVNNLATLVVAHFNGTSWNAFGANSYTGNVSNGTVTWNGVSTFSPFSLGSTSAFNNPLPVKFSAIKASIIGSDNKIEWTNLTEQGVAKYEVEKSTDGRSFITIVEKLPAVNNGALGQYSVLDNAVHNTTAHYRIKAIDESGLITYSSIVRVERNTTEQPGMLVYPNPVKDRRINIQLNKVEQGNYTVQLFNQAGQCVHSAKWALTETEASKTIQISSGLTPGFYILRVTGDQIIINSKIIVQ